MYSQSPNAHEKQYNDTQAKPPYAQPATGFPVSSASSYDASHNFESQPSTLPPNHIQSQPRVDWSTGLFDCFSDVKNYNHFIPSVPAAARCITCWCPCITFGRIAEIVDEGSTSCGVSGAVYTLIALVTGCQFRLSSSYRFKMREQHSLKGNRCCDDSVHFFCEPCALCQEYRELKNRGYNMVIGWQGNVEQRNRELAMTAATPPTIEQGMSR